MAVTSDKAGPYAPAATILQVVERHRSRGLPTPISAEVLARAGVSESLIPRTLQALQTLDLINERGEPTPAFEGIRKAPEAEYKARLADWLNATYADVLQFIDPANADEVAVRDAFRNYNPVGQQPRMVSLFMALYAAAGMRPEKTAPAPKQVTLRPRPLLKPLARPVVSKQIERKPLAFGSSSLPPTIAALLADLPPEGGGWTQEKRDKLIAMFESMLDYNYKIVEPLEAVMPDEDAA